MPTASAIAPASAPSTRTTRWTRALALALATLSIAALPGCDAEAPEPEDAVEDDSGALDSDPETAATATAKPAPAVACSGEITEAECTTEDGEEGISLCVVDKGEEVWTTCRPSTCWPGEGYDYGCMGSLCYFADGVLQSYSWTEPNCATPLVVAFDDAPLSFEPAGAAAFDISGRGTCMSTDWPSAPWLALDRDGDGTIGDGRELFGEGTRLASGDLASHGFAALAELDSDGDGRITAADPAFAELVLWSDDDSDRRGELRELVPVSEAGLVAIDLAYTEEVVCDARGNCGNQRARFDFRDASGALRSGQVIDVYLSCQ